MKGSDVFPEVRVTQTACGKVMRVALVSRNGEVHDITEGHNVMGMDARWDPGRPPLLTISFLTRLTTEYVEGEAESGLGRPHTDSFPA